MDESQREALAARVLAMAAVDLEVTVRDVDRGLTRFTQNAIHQNVAACDTTVRVRAQDGGRTGVAQTNDLGDASLRATVARAREVARLAPNDPNRPPLALEPRGHASPRAFAMEPATASPETRARAAEHTFAVAERHGLWAAGYASTARAGVTIANARGTVASYDGTTCAYNVKMNGPDATGYAEWYGNDVADLDATGRAQLAADKAIAGAAPRTVEPGAYTVVLEPAAFGELLSYLADHFSAQTYDEGSSFLSAGLDRAYASRAVTMYDDHAHPAFAGIPFDGEGTPTQRVALFDAGVARNVVTDATWSARLNRPNTGHAQPAPSASGPRARHLVVADGAASARSLVANVERGLLVTRLWYVRPVDQRRTIVTGMTRDGTFLIEHGRVTGGVRNLRFNQSILDALGASTFANDGVRSAGYGYDVVIPTVAIDGFRFTSTTAF